MEISQKEKNKEQIYLDKTTKVIKEKISELGQQLYDKEEKLKEFKELIWDSKQDMDPKEMRFMMTQSNAEVVQMERKSKYFQTLFRIQENPYFGKITFEDNEKQEVVYIGITYVEEDMNHYIHDWRSPICSLFYDYEIGEAKYQAPEGIITGYLQEKRQFKIENGKLKGIFDTSINIEDDVLQQVLAEDSNDRMKNIVNTIQQEQNKVIRNVEDKTLIVQGIAGSGKTSVALHRIAFLLYKIKNLSSDNVLIFSPNKVFSEYISNVLPELGEDNTLQTTFNQFMESNIKEYRSVEEFTKFIERYYKDTQVDKELITYKQSDQVITDITKYIEDYKEKLLFIEDLDTKYFTYTKEELNHFLKKRYNHLKLLDIIPTITSKICDTYYGGKKGDYKKLISLLKEKLNIKIDLKNIYRDFYHSKYFIESYHHELSEKDIKKLSQVKELPYEDACLFVFMKGLLSGFDYRGMIKQVVIDEAQDYNKLQYHLIKSIFTNASFTILGDTNQTINPYYKYESLQELENIWDEDTKYLELSKTYRSSKEIIEYTNKILGLNYVTAIRKENNIPVLFRKNKGPKDLIADVKRLKETYQSIAIITKTDEEASYIYEELKGPFSKLCLLESSTKNFNRNLIAVPAYTAKGLEFDSVIIYTDEKNPFQESEKYLYYVACTRAQHQLIIYNQTVFASN